VCRERAVYLLNASVGRETGRVKHRLTADDSSAQLLSRAGRLALDFMAYSATLHCDDRVVPIAPIGRGRQPSHPARRSGSQHLLGRDRGNMVALIDHDVPIMGQQLVQALAACEALCGGDVQQAGGLLLPAPIIPTFLASRSRNSVSRCIHCSSSWPAPLKASEPATPGGVTRVDRALSVRSLKLHDRPATKRGRRPNPRHRPGDRACHASVSAMRWAMVGWLA
jgi:hypothetical protein